MKETQYVVEFGYIGYSGIEPNLFEKRILESMFMEIYNQYAEMVNPLLNVWNETYDELHNGEDKVGQINSDDEYNSYMRQHLQTVVDVVINSMLYKRTKENDGQSRIKRFFIDEECNFAMELNDGTTMQFYLKEQ